MLHHAIVSHPGATPAAATLFCHGILGAGGNFRTLARAYVAGRPTHAAVLVDLRRHGQSLDEPGEDTLAACAEDLTRLRAALTAGGLSCDALVGHSFGGKAVLAHLAARSAAGEDAPVHAVILDSTPGARPLRNGSETTLDVLRALAATPKMVATREAFVDDLRGRGLTEMLARWLAMNLTPSDGAYRFRLDLAAIERLLEDYFRVDLWPLVDRPPAGVRLHFVLGGASRTFDDHDRARLAQAADHHPEAVAVTELPGAGHWVHVDDPEGTLRALLAPIP